MLGGGNGIAERRVHHDDAARGGSRNVDIVDADAGTADNFQVLGLFENLGGYFSGRANGEPVVIADDLGQLFLVLAKTGLEIDLDAALLWLRRKPNRAKVSALQHRRAQPCSRTRYADWAARHDDWRHRRRRPLS